MRRLLGRERWMDLRATLQTRRCDGEMTDSEDARATCVEDNKAREDYDEDEDRPTAPDIKTSGYGQHHLNKEVAHTTATVSGRRYDITTRYIHVGNSLVNYHLMS